MATGQELLSGVKQFYPFIDTENTNLTKELERRAAEGATLDQILNDVQGYGELQSGAQKTATSRLKPQLDLSLNALDIAGAGLNQEETAINRRRDTVGENLVKSAQGFEERQNQLGLLRSGQTSAGLQDILVKQKGMNEQDRAAELGRVALERAGIGTRRAQTQLQYAQSVDDLVNQLIQGGDQALSTMQKGQQDQALKALDIALTIPEGKTVDIPGLGTITGLKQPTRTGGSGGSAGAGGGVKTLNGKTLSITPAVLGSLDDILKSVPSDNPDAENDRYFSQNELNQAIPRVMATYNVDRAAAEELVQRAIDSGGYMVLNDWNTYSSEDQNRITEGTF